jgi:hypothetical protein
VSAPDRKPKALAAGHLDIQIGPKNVEKCRRLLLISPIPIGVKIVKTFAHRLMLDFSPVMATV